MSIFKHFWQRYNGIYAFKPTETKYIIKEIVIDLPLNSFAELVVVAEDRMKLFKI